MNNTFNIFEVLFKHDKELSHSAFIKFLLDQDDGFFLEKLLSKKGKKFKIKLEVNLNKKNRIDILLKSGPEIIAIENKFKCLPTAGQLNAYTESLSEKFPNSQIEKFLLYFSKGSMVSLPDDWNQITYSELHKYILEYLTRDNLTSDKRVFIEHYSKSLKSYIDKYDHLRDSNQNSLKNCFSNTKENKFWLNLMFHELAHLFNSQGFRTWVGAGGTYMPVLNVHIDGWNSEADGVWYEFVIQLNGQNLKYYAHLKGLKDKQNIISQEIQRLNDNGFKASSSGKFKNKVNAKYNTCYIYQEDILKVLEENNQKVTLENLKASIHQLISRVDKEQPVEAF